MIGSEILSLGEDREVLVLLLRESISRKIRHTVRFGRVIYSNRFLSAPFSRYVSALVNGKVARVTRRPTRLLMA